MRQTLCIYVSVFLVSSSTFQSNHRTVLNNNYNLNYLFFSFNTEPYNNQLSKEPDDQTVRASFSNVALGSVNVTLPLQGFFDWSYRHPKLTTFITVALVAVAGYSIYKYVTKKEV